MLTWWIGPGYAWLANLVHADQGIARVGMFAAMAVMFVLALTIPEAFDDTPGGLSGPVVVAVCYFIFRTLHLLLFYLSSRGDAGLRGQLLRFTPAMLGGTALLLAAAGTDGTTRTWLWLAALAVDYAGTYFGGARGWRVRSAGHFAERHGLIVIIALGESIVAIGVGVAHLPISWPIVVASTLGLALAGGLWWAYFGISAAAGEHALSTVAGPQRAGLARDAYSFLHLPLVAGIVLLALGLKKTLEYVGDEQAHSLADPLKGVALIALVGGTVMHLLAQAAFRWRTTGRLDPAPVVAAVLIVPFALLGLATPALATLAAVTVITVAAIVVETRRRSLTAR
jgi:low temperature requirement protein LtrA